MFTKVLFPTWGEEENPRENIRRPKSSSNKAAMLSIMSVFLPLSKLS